MSKSRNLLLCLDAFGTLFSPKRPIAQQYGEVARSLGMTGCPEQRLHASFTKAFKAEAKQHPNYGKAAGLDAERWWANVVHDTFKPFASPHQALPHDLAPQLWHRFSSAEAYTLFSDVLLFLRRMRHFSADAGGKSGDSTGRTIIGVLTNSDDRVPSILSSLGVKVSSVRYGSRVRQADLHTDCDVDFFVMSYDVGHEKPDRRMFDAAVTMLKLRLGMSEGDSVADWDLVYVGDEYKKDILGANGAGWSGMLVDRITKEDSALDSRILWPERRFEEECAPSKADFLRVPRALGFRSLTDLATWLLHERRRSGAAG